MIICGRDTVCGTDRNEARAPPAQTTPDPTWGVVRILEIVGGGGSPLPSFQCSGKEVGRFAT